MFFPAGSLSPVDLSGTVAADVGGCYYVILHFARDLPS